MSAHPGAPAPAAPAVGPAQLLAAAETAANAREWDRACELLAAGGETTDVLAKRAFCLSRAARFPEARELLEQLHAKDPRNFQWAHMIGFQHLQEEGYDQAVPWFLKAYALNPRHLKNLYRLAQARRQQGELTRAKFCAIEVLKLWHALPADRRKHEAKTFAKASYMLGVMQQQRDPEGALLLFEQAVAHDPGDHDKHYRLGKTLRRLGRCKEALAALRRAHRIKATGYIELELAAALADAGESGEAARHLARGTRGIRGWPATKAARIALRLDRPRDAQRLLSDAAREQRVRSSPDYKHLKREVQEALAAVPPAQAEPSASDGEAPAGVPRTGRVHHVRPERGFGFLIDDSDGDRCHFKLPRATTLRAGQGVRFVRADTDRGPAARDVQPAE
jgi:tetratricopeptide (TPR) repeat protein